MRDESKRNFGGGGNYFIPHPSSFIPVFFLFAFLLLSLPFPAKAIAVPDYEGWVTDRAGVIDGAQRAKIEAVIQSLKDNTGAEIAVLTVPSTGEEPPFDYAMAVAEAWKPGEKGKDTGVVFLVATEDRKMQILVGYGLEGILPDGKVGGIEDEYIMPSFKSGNYGEGILRGVAAMAAVIDPEHQAQYQGPSGTVSRENQRALPLITINLDDVSPAQKVTGICMFLVIAVVWLYLLVRHPRLALFFLFMLMSGSGGGRRSGGGSFGGGFSGFGGGSFGGGGAGRSW